MSSRARTSLGIGLSLVAAAGAAAWINGRRAVPSWSGQQRLRGLDAPVDILRDAWGVPAVFAATSHDAYFSQGWLHAADRGFQLDLMRHVGTGRLAELVGPQGVGSDRLVRVLGFHRAIKAEFGMMSTEARAGLDAYTEGVNAYWRRNARRMPVEFKLLGHAPEPWKPIDCLAVQRLLALGLCGNWESELSRGEIAARFGTDVLQVLDDDADVRGWPAQVDADVLGELVGAARDATSGFGIGGGIGSNNWVVGPDHTRSGGALLANDPHLDLQMPSLWYEQRLHGGDVDVRGFSIPGVPGIILGHNGRIAWGFTNSSADVQDLYHETIHEDGEQYLDVGGVWKPLTKRTERITVKGDEDVVVEVRSTRRGPILTDAAISSTLTDAISIRWDSIRAANLVDSQYELNRASDFESFRAALSKWTAPAQNVVYADAAGNIGFQHAGEVPVRAEGNNGTVPRRGDDPAGEWIGTIPWEDQVHSFNPAKGRIVTANDRIVSDGYPYFLSVEWMNGYRGQRIRNLIDVADGHTVGDQVRIQTDVFSIPGEQTVHALRQLSPRPRTEAGREVLAALMGWDGELQVDDDGGIAYRLFMRSIQDRIFGFLGELLPQFLGYSRTGVNGFWCLFGRQTPRIIAAIETGNQELLELGRTVYAGSGAAAALPGWKPARDWHEAVAEALDAAGEAYVGDVADGDRSSSRSLQRTGRRIEIPRLSSLRRRRYHRLRLQHALGVVPGFAQVANRGPFVVPGDADTVWQSSGFNNPTNDYAMVGPSHRNVVDMADLDRSVAILAGGQSGHPASQHYADQVPLWRSGEVRPAPFTREGIERLAKFRQSLHP